jgi:pantetheine-phosphate adenylyltransferase
VKALVPGSYDPVTLGHLDVIKRAAEKYDEVYSVVFINPDKKYMFSMEQRLKMLALATEDISNVTVDFSAGYVVDYMKEKSLDKIVKGYRSEKDLAYEKVQADYNFDHGGFETELLLCAPGLEGVSSTLARERLISGDSLDEILPKKVAEYIKNEKK